MDQALALPAALPPALARAAARVAPSMVEAAARTGVDFAALFHTARLESAFNPLARARTSSATGLFQFIDSTWLDTLARHGPRHGIQPGSRAEALALRADPAIASLMAAEHMADNARRLEPALGRPAEIVELYLAHFLGPGGAARFVKALADAPQQAAATLFPAAARANRAIFHWADGAPRSLAEVRDLFVARLGGGSAPRPPALQAAAAPPASAPARERAWEPAWARTPAAARGGQAAADPPDPSTPADPAAQARLLAQAAYLLMAELGA